MEAEYEQIATARSPLSIGSSERNGNGDALSSEDLDWVDSCLVNDFDLNESNWDSLKDALMGIIDSQSQSLGSEVRGNASLGGTGTGNFRSSEMADVSEVSGNTTNQRDNSGETEATGNNDDTLMNDLPFPGSSFQLIRTDDPSASGSASGIDLEMPSYGVESSTLFLSEILNSQSDSLGFVNGDDFPRATDVENLYPNRESEAEKIKGKRVVGNGDPSEVKTRENKDEPSINETKFSGNPFRPDYNDDIQGSVVDDLGLDLGFSPFEIEPLTKDIFRVWDLSIPQEEDELIKQLNKALEADTSESVPSGSDDSRLKSNEIEDSVDSLVSGLNDLTLVEKVV